MTLSANSAQTFLGGVIEYEVSVAPPPEKGSPISVTIGATDLVDATGLTLDPATLSIDESGSAKGWISVASTGDITTRSPVKISITTPTDGYTFVPADKFVDVPIVAAPTQATEISIIGPSAFVTEGASADFTIMANNQTRTSDLTIQIDVKDIDNRTSADYITEDTYYVVLKSDQESVPLSIPTNDNSEAGIDGVLEATIQDGVGYTHPSATETAYVDVYDNDGTPTELSVVAVGSGDVVEGDNVEFRINRFGGSGELTIEYEILQNGGVLPADFETNTLPNLPTTISADQPNIIVRVPTVFSRTTTLADDASVTLRIKSIHEAPSAEYRIRVQSVTRTIVDKIPEITFLGMPSSVTQGHPFSFVVQADPAPTTNLPVGINIGASGADVFVGSTPSTALATNMITIPADDTAGVSITVTTVNGAGSGNETHTIAIAADTEATARYTSSATASVVLKDNSSPSESQPSVAFESYSSDQVSTTDNTPVTFKIIASHTPNPPKGVWVRVSSTGTNFITGGNVLKRQELNAGGTETDFVVAISDPNTGTNDPNGTITVELVDGDGYTLVDATASPNNHTTSATINDDLTRTVSITAPLWVVEGESVTFSLEASPVLTGTETLSVVFAVTHSGSDDYYNETTLTPSSPITLTQAENSKDITFTTHSDLPSVDANGQITIQVTAGLGYEPASAEATIVNVQDKEQIPDVSVAVLGESTITEGENAVFELTAGAPDVTTDFDATVTVSQPDGAGNFLASAADYNTTVTIDATTNKGTLSIPTLADNVYEIDGTISVTVQADPNTANPATRDYTKRILYEAVATPATITIEDNDTSGATHTVTVSAPAKVYEGQNAVFTFTATPALTGEDEIAVNYVITKTGAILADSVALTGTINIDADGPAKLPLPTTSDATAEADGSVTVEVLAYTSGGTLSYNVGAKTPGTNEPDYIASAELIDDDVDDGSLPSVTIAVVDTEDGNDDSTISEDLQVVRSRLI